LPQLKEKIKQPEELTLTGTTKAAFSFDKMKTAH